MLIDPVKEDDLIILENANVVYLEYKVIVFYESNGSLYYFGIPYESDKISILRPFDDREEVVEKVNLEFSKYDNTKRFEENIKDNLEDISIFYQGYVDSDLNLAGIESEKNSEPSSVAVHPMPMFSEDADGNLILSIDELGWVSVSDVITINYENPVETYKINLPKDSLLLRKTTDEYDIIYVWSTKLIFSQIDPDKDLQENIDSYLVGASVEYPKVVTPPSPY